METFKFIKGKYTNEKVVADSGVIKAVLSNGTDVTDSVNDETFQTAALASGNVSDKEVKVYTLRESLSNINPIGEVTSDNAVRISSLGVTKSPSGAALPQDAAAELSNTSATAILPKGITWNNSSGDDITNVNVTVGEATVTKTAKFTISGKVTVKKFVKASGNVSGNVYTKNNLATGGSTGDGYYKDGRKCVVIEAYKTEKKETKNPSNLGSGSYYNLVVNSEINWKLGINLDGNIGSTTTEISKLKDNFNIKDVSFDERNKVMVSAWKKNGDTSYTKKSEVTVRYDPTIYYEGLRLPSGDCFDINGKLLNSVDDLTKIDIVYKEQCDVTFNGVPYKYSTDTKTYYTYNSEDTVDSSKENCNINGNMLVPNQTPFTKVGDENSIYLNTEVKDVQKSVEFQ